MRTSRRITSPVIAIAIAAAITASLAGCSGTIPDTLGVTGGKLPPCPDKPNCVVSHNYDETHHIAPLVYSGELSDAYSELLADIEKMPGSAIITKNERYIHAEFTSSLMRYVDDVEFYFDTENKQIELRSASRLGHSDMGVNRERIEALREIQK